MKVILHEDAEKDLENGFRFYEQQKPGLRDDFLETLLSEIDLLISNAGIHSKVLGSFKVRTDRFPNAIYYRIADDEITVRAVIDCRRDPRRIQRRLRRID